MKQDRIFQKPLLVLIFFSLILELGSCSQGDVEFQSKSFKSRLQQGDYHLGWSLNYFDSWRNARQPRYLRLAESHSINAINSFASLESDTSPRISEFYVCVNVGPEAVGFLRNFSLKPWITGINFQEWPHRGVSTNSAFRLLNLPTLFFPTEKQVSDVPREIPVNVLNFRFWSEGFPIH